MTLNIPLSTDQKEKVLEMFRYYYLDEINNDAPYILPNIDENGVLEYDPNKPKIHWYEFVSNILIKKITNNNFYWVSVYLNTCIQQYSPKHIHPIEFVYDKFTKVINKESLFVITENDFVAEKEKKESEKDAKKKASKSKNSKMPIEETSIETDEINKKSIKMSDFLK